MHCGHVTLLKLMVRHAARQVAIQSGVITLAVNISAMATGIS